MSQTLKNLTLRLNVFYDIRIIQPLQSEMFTFLARPAKNRLFSYTLLIIILYFNDDDGFCYFYVDKT